MATLESIEAQITTLSNQASTKFNTLITKVDDLSTKLDAMAMFNTCPVCQGSGEVNDPADGEPGPPYTCPRCSGSGSVKSGELEEE